MEHEINERPPLGCDSRSSPSGDFLQPKQNAPPSQGTTLDVTDGLWTFYAFYTVDCINSWPGYGYAF